LSFTCNCPEDNTGTYCEILKPCTDVDCGLGSCVTSDDWLSFTCSCPEDNTGTYCEIIKPCTGVDCNSGSCLTSDDWLSFTCDCLEDKTGTYCELDFQPGTNPNEIEFLFPTASESPAEVVIETVLGIFEAYGIPGITFVDEFYSSRKRRNAEDALDAIADYGCWCSKPFAGNAHMGKPLDEVDQLCKKWSQCTRCMGLNGCSGDVNDAYDLTFVPATDSYTCNAVTGCGLSRCECTGELGITLARALINNNFQLDGTHNEVTDAECVRGTGASFTDACCGVAPAWMPYNTQMDQCLNGDIIPL